MARRSRQQLLAGVDLHGSVSTQRALARPHTDQRGGLGAWKPPVLEYGDRGTMGRKYTPSTANIYLKKFDSLIPPS